MEGLEDPGDALVHLVRHQWNQGAPGACHGLSYKQTCLICRISHSQAARPALVDSLEPAGVNLGLHAHYEAEFLIGREFGHHPLYLSGLLRRCSRVSEVYDNTKKHT